MKRKEEALSMGRNTVIQLDLSGLACPMPLLRAKLALNKMAVGDVLEAEVTDPGSWRDFASFCQLSGHQLLSASDENGVFTYQIKKV